MKTAIIYASTHGTTERVAMQIRDALGESAHLFNLKSSINIDLNGYNQVVVGGSIHAGQIQGRVKKFCKQNMVALLQKRVALFICGMNEPQFEAELTGAFPELLRRHAFSARALGGEFCIEKMNFFEKLIVRKVSGVSQSVSKLNQPQIDELIRDLKN